MDNDSGPISPELKTTWLAVQPPIEFYLTAEGTLTVEFGLVTAPGVPMARFGIEIPVERVKVLREGLHETRTIQETLAVKPPAQGAH